MATKKNAKLAVTRITDDMKLKVVKKENPFSEGTVQAKHAAAVLAANGLTVAAAKKKGADGWTVRELVKRRIVQVQKNAA